ncbi:MAG: hypothetical protein OHK0026_03350 [Rhodocyclaceae bacterium]
MRLDDAPGLEVPPLPEGDEIVWGESYSTGIAAVDAEHRRIIEFVGAIARARHAKAGAAAIRGLLRSLREFCGSHFATEEALMERAGCAPRHVIAHKREHRDFARHIQLFDRWLAEDPALAGGPTLSFLSDWLIDHVLRVDKSMARQIEAIGRGVPADEALKAEARLEAESSEALLGTVHRLYAELSTYNARLRDRNEELARRKEEIDEAREALARANRELEDRVAERTAALEAAKRRLEDANGQLLHAEKMASIGQLAAGIAHEINNPVGFVSSNLTTLKGYAQALLSLIAECERIGDRLAPEDAAALAAARTRADLDYIRQDIVALIDESRGGLDRVRKIIRDLRDFSHVGDAQWQLADLHAGLDSTLNVVRNELKYKAEVVKEYGELPLVRCLPGQIKQVFMNLLVNAAQAIEERGTIRLASGSREGWAWVEVADTGQGMSPEVQRRIFDPFYTTKPVGKGTGLGLSVSWGIVKRHGGRFEVESTPGRGTTMRVWLPVAGPEGGAD